MSYTTCIEARITKLAKKAGILEESLCAHNREVAETLERWMENDHRANEDTAKGYWTERRDAFRFRWAFLVSLMVNLGLLYGILSSMNQP